MPPPLDAPLDVERHGGGVRVVRGETRIAEAWPASDLELDVPAPPGFDDAERASRDFSGFRSHRFPTCFVCGVDRKPGDGLRLFAGPVADRDLVACTWIPDPSLSKDGRTVDPVFVWSALDCPGGFSFPHPRSGTILLGELTVRLQAPLEPGAPAIVIGWQIGQDGRKHFTGTALFSSGGAVCHGAGRATWFEVPDDP